jgi:hypothetical protein
VVCANSIFIVKISRFRHGLRLSIRFAGRSYGHRGRFDGHTKQHRERAWLAATSALRCRDALPHLAEPVLDDADLPAVAGNRLT